jgi:hypothetical protein
MDRHVLPESAGYVLLFLSIPEAYMTDETEFFCHNECKRESAAACKKHIAVLCQAGFVVQKRADGTLHSYRR